MRVAITVIAAALMLGRAGANLVQDGMAAFAAGRVAESIELFNRAADVDPPLASRLWQRGLSQCACRERDRYRFV